MPATALSVLLAICWSSVATVCKKRRARAESGTAEVFAKLAAHRFATVAVISSHAQLLLTPNVQVCVFRSPGLLITYLSLLEWLYFMHQQQLVLCLQHHRRI